MPRQILMQPGVRLANKSIVLYLTGDLAAFHLLSGLNRATFVSRFGDLCTMTNGSENSSVRRCSFLKKWFPLICQNSAIVLSFIPVAPENGCVSHASTWKRSIFTSSYFSVCEDVGQYIHLCLWFRTRGTNYAPFFA